MNSPHPSLLSIHNALAQALISVQQDHCNICSLSSVSPWVIFLKSKSNQVTLLLRNPYDDLLPINLRQNSLSGEQNTLNNLISSFILSFATPHSHSELLTQTYQFLSQFGAFAPAITFFWKVLLAFSDWQTRISRPNSHFTISVALPLISSRQNSLPRSLIALVYVSIIILITLYCNFPFHVSVTPLHFELQEVKNLHLLIFCIPRV